MTNNEKFCQMLNSCRHPRKVAMTLCLMHSDQTAYDEEAALMEEFENILRQLTQDELEIMREIVIAMGKKKGA